MDKETIFLLEPEGEKQIFRIIEYNICLDSSFPQILKSVMISSGFIFSLKRV